MGVYKGKSVDEAIENGLLDLNLKKKMFIYMLSKKAKMESLVFLKKKLR